MKKLLTLILLLHLSLAYGQIPTSKEFKLSNAAPYEVIDGKKWYIGYDDKIIAFKQSKKGLHAQKFDAEKGALKSRKEYPALNSKASIVDVLKHNGQVIVFYEEYNKDNSSENLFYFTINSETLAVGPRKKIVSTSKKIRNRTFKIEQNFSGDVIAVSYSLKPDVKMNKKSFEIVGYHVFDGDMNPLWDRELELPETEAKLDVISYCIDENTNVHLLAKIYSDDTRKDYKKDGTMNFDFEFFRIEGESGNVVREKSRLKDQNIIIKTLSFFAGRNGNIMLAGYYGDSRKSGLNGAFTADFEGTGELYNFTATPFDVAEFKKYNKPRKQEKIEKKTDKKDGQVTLNNLQLRDVFVHADGGTISIGEIFYINIVRQKNGSEIRYYYSEDIYAMRTDAEGKLVWFRKIPKKQMNYNQSVGVPFLSYSMGGGREGLGFAPLMHKDNLYLIFLDNENNIGLTPTERATFIVNHKGGIVNSYKIDAGGKVSQHTIADNKNYNGFKLYQFNIDRVMPLNNGFGIEFYVKKKQDLMLRVHFSGEKAGKASKSKK